MHQFRDNLFNAIIGRAVSDHHFDEHQLHTQWIEQDPNTGTKFTGDGVILQRDNLVVSIELRWTWCNYAEHHEPVIDMRRTLIALHVVSGFSRIAVIGLLELDSRTKVLERIEDLQIERVESSAISEQFQIDCIAPEMQGAITRDVWTSFENAMQRGRTPC